MPKNVQRPAKLAVSERQARDESARERHGPKRGQVGAKYHLPRSNEGTIARNWIHQDRKELIETDRSLPRDDDRAERSDCCEAPEEQTYAPQSIPWDSLDSLPTHALAFQIGFRYSDDFHPSLRRCFAVRLVP